MYCMGVDSNMQICNQILHIDNTLADIRCPICDKLINKLTPHIIPKIQKFSPKLMLTQYTSYICIFNPLVGSQLNTT